MTPELIPPPQNPKPEDPQAREIRRVAECPLTAFKKARLENDLKTTTKNS